MFTPSKLPQYIVGICIIFLAACSNNIKEGSSKEDTLFSLLPADQTHVDFNNTIVESKAANIISYQYFYNGGGVATGDLNSDGLEDIYFSGNMTKAKLYLNKGKMQFEDITVKSGITELDISWKTGVTFADVNGDGKLDIYQCYSGGLPSRNRQNTLFINQGNDADGSPVFKEEAAKYGLNDDSYSTQAVFFDYDGDNNLDMFLLNHNPKVFTTLEETSAPIIFKDPAPTIRVKLFRNVNGKFEDFSDRAGLYNSSFTYGLGAGISDINNDGRPDIYISNDYSARDYLYINNGDGTFTDQLQKQIGHISMYSMGNDIADVNNDGLADILTLDMLPEDNHRQKLLFAPDNYEYNDLRLKLGLHHQDMRNMLHINNGNGTFSEVGQLSGISNTDWSWAPLFADYDNDGWKDLFISNGYLRDYTNMDFLKFKGDFLRGTDPALVKENLLELINNMPASNVNNYIYRNNGDLTFSNKDVEWGMNIPSNSNGAAYSDLDNDGDLDLVINNINLPAFVYQNNSAEKANHNFLKLKLTGAGHNTQGLGAKVWLYVKDSQQYLEQNPSRGYQSSISPILHFGIGKTQVIDSLRIVWQGGKQQVLKAIKPNQVLSLEEKNANSNYSGYNLPSPLFREVPSPVVFAQQKNNLNDFKRQPLLINPMSLNGPCLAKADVNGDGLEDMFVGGGHGQSAALFIQSKNGNFTRKDPPVFEQDKNSDDVDAAFFDANGDGFVDLYVASGGYHHFSENDPLLQDRLYINNGKGGFSQSKALPKMHSSKGCVAAADFNGDGHQDVFVGGKSVPGRYPEASQSYLLINDGAGNFTDQLNSIAPAFQKPGMVTDAGWADLNGDKKPDLVLVGDWMPVTVLINENGKLVDRTKNYFEKSYTGWWNTLVIEDLNGDGTPDLIVGNTGLNTQCKASESQPAEMYYKDFDDNGSVDPILCLFIQGKSYPYVTRDELFDQMSMMRNRYPDYKSYADRTMSEIFTAEELKGAVNLKANHLKTSLFLSNGKGKFKEAELPIQVQNAPIYAITTVVDQITGYKNLLFCGNINRARLKFGNSDANFGMLLKNNGKGSFQYVPQRQSGFKIQGDVRSVISLKDKLIFGINQQEIKAYQLIAKD